MTLLGLSREECLGTIIFNYSTERRFGGQQVFLTKDKNILLKHKNKYFLQTGKVALPVQCSFPALTWRGWVFFYLTADMLDTT